MTPKPRRTVPKVWLGVLAVLAGGVAGSLVVALLAGRQPDPSTAQLAMLERRVDALQARAKTGAQLQAALTPPAESEWLPNYQIECAPPWRELGAIGRGLWGCQAPQPLPSGFYPNCNLTASPTQPGLTAKAYFEAASSSDKPLSAARQLGGRTVRLRHQNGYEGSFEHRLMGTPLRVLATVVVQDEHAFAITCSAPPEVFDTLAPRFRAIAASFDLGG